MNTASVRSTAFYIYQLARVLVSHLTDLTGHGIKIILRAYHLKNIIYAPLLELKQHTLQKIIFIGSLTITKIMRHVVVLHTL